MPRADLGRDFALLWGGHSVSKTGSQITILALPAVALFQLDATNFEIGLLTAGGYLAFLLVGLPAGVWVDRARKRRVMITAAVIRFAVLLAVPAAAVLDVLSMALLYVVALVLGLCTVFFDVAYRSVLPALVPQDKLMAANGRLELAVSAAQVAGPTAGGFLIAMVTAPFAILADAVSHLVSAVCLARIRAPDDRVSGERRSSSFWYARCGSAWRRQEFCSPWSASAPSPVPSPPTGSLVRSASRGSCAYPRFSTPVSCSPSR